MLKKNIQDNNIQKIQELMFQSRDQLFHSRQSLSKSASNSFIQC